MRVPLPAAKMRMEILAMGGQLPLHRIVWRVGLGAADETVDHVAQVVNLDTKSVARGEVQNATFGGDFNQPRTFFNGGTRGPIEIFLFRIFPMAVRIGKF